MSERRPANPARSNPTRPNRGQANPPKSSRSQASRGLTARSQTGRTQTGRSQGSAGTSRTTGGSRPAARTPRSRSHRPAFRLPVARPARRLNVALVVLLAVMVTFMGRAFMLQAWDAQAYAAEAAAKMKASNTLIAQRGTITDRNGQVLAATQPAVRVVADPLMISRNGVDSRITMSSRQRAKADAAPEEIAKILADHLGGDPAEYRAQLTDVSKKHYLVIARQVPAWTYQTMRDEIAAGGWYGIYKEDDPIRTYPAGDLASNIVGFMNAEGKGAGGLEYALDAQLTGINGKEIYDSSWNGRIPLGTNTLVPAQDGTSYTLTLDSEMQVMANQALSAGVTRAGAKSGIAIVMNVKTGELLALSTTPGFDSNSPGTADSANLGNRAVSAPYEPGSVQKVITMAALADQGLVDADTKVQIPSRLASGDGRIKDAFEHGTIYLTGRGVIANSSNIGTVLLTRQLAKSTLHDYLLAFGLGTRTGIGLPGESAGWLPARSMPDYSRDQIAFGQGLSVTGVQEAAAVAAIANGGLYNKPTLIKSGIDAEGRPAAVPSSEPRRVVSPEAAATVLEMMESVITLKKSRKLENYRWAGKTGTAQRVDPSCSCYRGYTASFVGVAPVEDPQILTYVVIDQPTRGTDGSTLALPVAQQIMGLALPRYGVAPSTSAPPSGKLDYTP